MAPIQRPPRFWVLLLAVILPFVVIAGLDLAMRAAPVIDPALRVESAATLESGAKTPIELPTEGWQTRKLPARPAKSGTRPASAWFRVEFAAPARVEGQWAVFIENPYANFALFVNGAFIGDAGPMTSPIPVHRTPLLFRFPAKLLHPGVNTLEVRIVHPYNFPRLSDAAIGPVEAVVPAYKFAQALRVEVKHATAIVLSVLAILIGAMSRLRRRDAAYAWFACGILGWAAHIEMILIAQSPI
ncbi:MAG TPA: hypothetical protein VFS58_06455, partial [Steroidobacteraceae bacterium]|nr:hypothetical protein [Steroidobacteraceae bacterium]